MRGWADPASRPGKGLQPGICLPTAQPGLQLQLSLSCPACTAELDREKSSSLGSVESANSLPRAATAAGGEGVAAYARAKARLAERYAKMTRDAQRARLEQASARGECHQCVCALESACRGPPGELYVMVTRDAQRASGHTQQALHTSNLMHMAVFGSRLWLCWTGSMRGIVGYANFYREDGHVLERG